MHSIQSYKESNENINVNISAFISFLKEIRKDFQNGNTQLHIALSKFQECYRAAKLKSIPRLVSFLYNLNNHLDLTVNIKSGSMICVQIESIK